MNEIFSLIQLLNDQEINGFIKELEKRNKRKQNTSLSLLKALLLKKEDEIKAEIGSNAYYVTINRLKENLINYVSSKIYEQESSIENGIIKLLLLARKLLLSQKYQLGFKLLEQSKKQAMAIENLALLNEIYHTFIQHAHLPKAPELDLLIRQYENNLSLFLQSEKRNMANAKVKKAFLQAEQKESKVSLEEVFKEYQKEMGSITHIGNYKDLLQLAQIADLQGTYTRNYAMVNTFFVSQTERLEGSIKDNEQQHQYHIELLYLIANIYLRKTEFKKSILYLKKMEAQMQRFQKKHYIQFESSYTTLLALNYNFSGEPSKAAELIQNYLSKALEGLNDQLNPMLVLSMINFQQKDYKAALKQLSKLNESDKYYEKSIGKEWLLNKKYMEILLHIELDNLDYVDSKIQSLIRTHGNYLKAQKHLQAVPFLKLVKHYIRKPQEVKRKEFIKKVEQTLILKPNEKEDLFLMSFYAWLKSKMTAQDIYPTTLELINKQ